MAVVRVWLSSPQGVINIGDLEDVLTTDDVEAAYKHIVEHPLVLNSEASDKK